MTNEKLRFILALVSVGSASLMLILSLPKKFGIWIRDGA